MQWTLILLTLSVQTLFLPLDLWEILALVLLCSQPVLVCDRWSVTTVRLRSLDRRLHELLNQESSHDISM